MADDLKGWKKTWTFRLLGIDRALWKRDAHETQYLVLDYDLTPEDWFAAERERLARSGARHDPLVDLLRKEVDVLQGQVDGLTKSIRQQMQELRELVDCKADEGSQPQTLLARVCQLEKNDNVIFGRLRDEKERLDDFRDELSKHLEQKQVVTAYYKVGRNRSAVRDEVAHLGKVKRVVRRVRTK